jgi:hypothetical protein
MPGEPDASKLRDAGGGQDARWHHLARPGRKGQAVAACFSDVDLMLIELGGRSEQVGVAPDGAAAPYAPPGGCVPGSTVYCPAAKRATAALVRTPWVTLTHASAACSTAG